MADSSNNNNNNDDLDISSENDMKRCYENLIVIDAGANLTNKKYSRDLDSVVQRAKDAGKFTHTHIAFQSVMSLFYKLKVK